MADKDANRPRRSGASLRLKLSLGLVLIIGMLFAGNGAFNLLTARSRLMREAKLNGATIANLAYAAMVPELPYHKIRSERIRSIAANVFNTALHLAKTRHGDLAYLLIVDPDHKYVVGRARPKLTVFPGNKFYNDEMTALNKVATLRGNLRGSMYTVRFPLKVKGKGTVGTLYVGTSFARIARQNRRDLILNIGVLTAVLLLLAVYATVALGRMVIAPLRQVVAAMRAVQEGDLDSEVNLARGDEIGVLADTYNFMVRGLRERERLKDAFSRYVSRQVYEKFQSGAVTLTGETREATVLFSDIRSFTTLSEQLTPDQVVGLLNEYFTEMVEIIFKYDGFLNKFIGDAIMAIYNVPLSQEQAEMRAVHTGLEMIAALERLNAKRAGRGEFPIKIGIGINTGPVVAGNIGHEQRLEYTVIGDTVNLAQRIESQTKVAGAPLLISEYTHKVVSSLVESKELPPVKVKGKAQPVTLYAVTGLRGAAAVPFSPTPAPTAPPPLPAGQV